MKKMYMVLSFALLVTSATVHAKQGFKSFYNKTGETITINLKTSDNKTVTKIAPADNKDKAHRINYNSANGQVDSVSVTNTSGSHTGMIDYNQNGGLLNNWPFFDVTLNGSSYSIAKNSSGGSSK